MEKKLTKIELGCGSKKSEGYIGIDRFALPDVDIVADLDQGIPFDADSVDAIYASHSLEHLADIEFIMNEIYRVAKNKAILMILAPYYFQTLNMANFYHKLVFSEDTFRFLTPYETSMISPEEYICPGIDKYGLSHSDNSMSDIAFELLYREFFYYEEYRNLSEQEKLHARKTFLNVCDQFYIALAVNKTGSAFSREELEELLTIAKTLEPKGISDLRARDQYANGEKKSFFSDIDDRITRIAVPINDFNKREKTILNRMDKLAVAQSEQVKRQNLTNSEIIERVDKLFADCDRWQQLFSNLTDRIAKIEAEHASYAAVIYDLVRFQEQRTRVLGRKLYRKDHNLLPSLKNKYYHFFDGLALKCKCFSAKKILTLSDAIPFDHYVEYIVSGYGNSINIFLIANLNAKLDVEIEINDQVVRQETLVLDRDGNITISTDDIKGYARLRFRIPDNRSIVRLLQITSRKALFFSSSELAAFIS